MKYIYVYIVCLFLAGWGVGCVEDPVIEGGLRNAQEPSVRTVEILKSTASSVTVSGEVTRENGAPVTEAGFCWGHESDFPFREDARKAVSEGKKTYETTIENLVNDVEYYVRAYAINAVDTAYGEVLSFRTKDGLGSVRTSTPVDVRSSSARCGGVITAPGEAEVELRGVYLMAGPEPSAADSLIECEMEADSFYCDITGLKPETTYYVRAFAKNKYGEYNGAKVEMFRTTNGFPVLDNESFALVKADYTFAEFSLVVTDEGDAPVTACGFCFGEQASPTIENADTIVCGSGAGTFTGRIEKMQQQKGYYVRAYATNAYGTVYSEGEGIHTVLESELPTVATGEVTDIRSGTARVTGEVLAEGVSPVSESGVCWGTDANPTLNACEGFLALSSGKGPIEGIIDGLRGGETYYVRIYARNEAGVTYGESVSFQTSAIFGKSISFEGSSLIPGSAAFCVMMGSSGFLLGGDTGSEYTDAFWRYREEDGWKSLKPQPERLSGQAGFSIGFGVWAFGGEDKTGKTCDSLYVYSTLDNSWSPVLDDWQSRPKGMYRAACCVLDDQAFLMGGRRGNEEIDEVWMYDPRALAWSRKANFPEKQYGGVAVVLNDRIYAGLGIVGRNNPSLKYTSRLWSTDASAEAWEEETPFPGESLQAGVAYGNQLYGVDSSGYVWCYDASSKAWTRKSQLPDSNRTVHCMYVLDDLIYIGLGSSSDSLITYDPSWDN